MPRSRPPKTITLLLPSTPSTSSSSSTSSTAMTEHDLEVLLHAQKLASERGQFLDIKSFMTPTQRTHYLSSLKQYRPLPEAASTLHSTPNPPPDLVTQRPLEEDITVPPPQSASTPHPPSPTSTAPPPDSPSALLPTQPPPKKPRPLPDLSHLHWKQRQKRLAMIASGEIGEDSDLFIEKDKDPPGTPGGAHSIRVKGEVNKEAIQSSASYWNHLLIQARQARGPQWDYNTQSYQIDRSTKDYYTHMSKPQEPVKPEVPPLQVNGGQYETPGPGMGMRTPSTGRMESTPRTGGGYAQPRLPPHLSGHQQQYTPSPAMPVPSHPPPPPQHPQSQSRAPPPYQTQIQAAQLLPPPTYLPTQGQAAYSNPQTRPNPSQMTQLQLAQLGAMNPAMLQGRAPSTPGIGGAGGVTNPSSLGGGGGVRGINLSALSGLPGMTGLGSGGGGVGGMMAGVNGMQMIGGGTLNPLGQHNFVGSIGQGQGHGQGQGQGQRHGMGYAPMVAGQAGGGPMLGGGWGEHGHS